MSNENMGILIYKLPYSFIHWTPGRERNQHRDFVAGAQKKNNQPREKKGDDASHVCITKRNAIQCANLLEHNLMGSYCCVCWFHPLPSGYLVLALYCPFTDANASCECTELTHAEFECENSVLYVQVWMRMICMEVSGWLSFYMTRRVSVSSSRRL